MASTRFLFCLSACLAVTCNLASAQEQVLFEKDIVPIFEAHCLKCHGQGKLRGGLDLRRKFTIEKGGDGGSVLVPGKPGDSVLVQRVDKGEMPPPTSGKLAPRQRDLIRRWVAQGALLAKSPEPPLEEAVAKLSPEDRNFWAFQTPRRHSVPRVKHQDRVRTPIDAFLLEKLEAQGLSFNPDAPRHVLLRRLSFDLLGLPPTPDMMAEFLADQRPDAYEKLVDRLLAMPEYGERWGRHWLDLAGYADSDGYLAADRVRPEAWRYRDYVIQAHNDDLPYDRFITEQLAGDQLSDWRRADRLTPDMKRQLIATGFLRTALDPTYPSYTEPNEIHQVLSDTMQIVSTTFLGLTLQCARCHDHKFDPISQRDYFAVQTTLLPALDPARWQPSGVRGILLGSDAEIGRMKAEVAKLDQQIAQANTELAKTTEQYRLKRLVAELTKNKLDVDAPTKTRLLQALIAEAKKRTLDQNALVAKFAPKLTLADTDLVKAFPEFKAVSEKLKADIAKLQDVKKSASPVLVRGLTDLDGKQVTGHVLRRGDFTRPGAVVAPGVPVVLASEGFALKGKAEYKSSGTRLALAKWLTDPQHPLTARVQVNRMWAEHFGKGIVPTLANFGRSGARPSHPELLDWLATEFIRSGWSMKTMHRLMVTSTAYRQSSDLDKSKAAVDPKNNLLWAFRPTRHQGEVLRDSVLAAAGKLTKQRFGPPVPVQVQGNAIETPDTPDGNRRSIYLIVRRSQHVTMLELFDTPMMEVNCPERPISTVPLQALAMLHGPFAERNAAALADRLLAAEPANEEARLVLAFRLLYTREPRLEEAQKIRTFIAALLSENNGPTGPRAAWTQVALVLLNSNEFLYVP